MIKELLALSPDQLTNLTEYDKIILLEELMCRAKILEPLQRKDTKYSKTGQGKY